MKSELLYKYMNNNRFSKRSEEDEIMDNLECSGEIIDQTLHELHVINQKLGGNRVTINGIQTLLRKNPPLAKITIADIGCGGGDILIEIAKWASKRNIKVDLIGIDANPSIIKFAEKNAARYPNISFEALNIFSEEFKRKQYDIVVSSLFTHHFRDEQLIALFTCLKKQARIGVVINDLHRHWLAYYSIKVIVRFFSKSTMVKHDGPLSVLRAFRKRELKNMLKKAGVHKYTLKWMWAFRWQLIFFE